MTTKKTQETAPSVEAPVNNDCFIIMPIADHSDYKDGHFKRVYEDILAPACRGAGYRPVRADDVAQTNLIHLDILQKLLESPMAICDLSTRNPNVLFELGLRQAFDKPTVLVQEVGTPQIFDINLFRYTQYRNGLDYRDVLADQKSIQKVLEETKLAVQENRSVNSIIKLLSIMEPAKLQDTSNFGEKEYFSILMNEISSIKKQLITTKNQNEYIKKFDNDNLFPHRYMLRITANDHKDASINGFIDHLLKFNVITDVEFDEITFNNDIKRVEFSTKENVSEDDFVKIGKLFNISIVSQMLLLF